jgi:hypothetical protein
LGLARLAVTAPSVVVPVEYLSSMRVVGDGMTQLHARSSRLLSRPRCANLPRSPAYLAGAKNVVLARTRALSPVIWGGWRRPDKRFVSLTVIGAGAGAFARKRIAVTVRPTILVACRRAAELHHMNPTKPVSELENQAPSMAAVHGEQTVVVLHHTLPWGADCILDDFVSRSWPFVPGQPAYLDDRWSARSHRAESHSDRHSQIVTRQRVLETAPRALEGRRM